MPQSGQKWGRGEGGNKHLNKGTGGVSEMSKNKKPGHMLWGKYPFLSSWESATIQISEILV